MFKEEIKLDGKYVYIYFVLQGEDGLLSGPYYDSINSWTYKLIYDDRFDYYNKLGLINKANGTEGFLLPTNNMFNDDTEPINSNIDTRRMTRGRVLIFEY
jgi:hypothetical protein